jgi:hypothetical protein
MKGRSGLILLIMLVSLPFPAHRVSAENRCNVTADNLLSKVKSWPDLHKWFKDHADCHNGDLVDDVAEYVTSSLARNWKDFPQFESEIKKEPRFKDFVLHHIDTIAPIADLEAVKRNAQQRCPAGSAPLCAEVAAAAQDALDGNRHGQ